MLDQTQVLEVIARHITTHKDISVDVTDHGIVNIKFGVFSIVIQAKQEVVQITNSNLALSKSHSFWEWDNIHFEVLGELEIDASYWVNILRPMLFEIIELLEAGMDKELSIFDQVKSILFKNKVVPDCNADLPFEIIEDGGVSFWSHGIRFTIHSSNLITIAIPDKGYHGSKTLKSWEETPFKELEDKGVSYSFWYDRYWPSVYQICRMLEKGKAAETAKPEEPSLEEEFRIILQSHGVKQSDEESKKTCITKDGIARIYASELVIVIQSEGSVMHISTLNPIQTFTHGFSEWDNFDATDFSAPSAIGYWWWSVSLKPALFKIIEMLESPDAPSESPKNDNDTENEKMLSLSAINDELQARLAVYEMPLESQVQSAESALKYLSERIEEHKARVAELNSHRYSMEDDASILSSEIELLDRKIRRRNDQTKAAEKEKVTNESET